MLNRVSKFIHTLTLGRRSRNIQDFTVDELLGSLKQHSNSHITQQKKLHKVQATELFVVVRYYMDCLRRKIWLGKSYMKTNIHVQCQ